MDKDAMQRAQAIDEKIQELERLRQRWADEKNLTPEERVRQPLTLELLDDALRDLLKKRRALEASSND
jgi:hypothetical protein